MHYYVYMIKTIAGFRNKTYVGYTNDVRKRLSKHNSNLGAKSTKGYQWKLIYIKTFKSKSSAMKFEYELKKDKNKRILIKSKSEK